MSRLISLDEFFAGEEEEIIGLQTGRIVKDLTSVFKKNKPVPAVKTNTATTTVVNVAQPLSAPFIQNIYKEFKTSRSLMISLLVDEVILFVRNTVFTISEAFQAYTFSRVNGIANFIAQQTPPLTANIGNLGKLITNFLNAIAPLNQYLRQQPNKREVLLEIFTKRVDEYPASFAAKEISPAVYTNMYNVLKIIAPGGHLQSALRAVLIAFLNLAGGVVTSAEVNFDIARGEMLYWYMDHSARLPQTAAPSTTATTTTTLPPPPVPAPRTTTAATTTTTATTKPVVYSKLPDVNKQQ